MRFQHIRGGVTADRSVLLKVRCGTKKQRVLVAESHLNCASALSLSILYRMKMFSFINVSFLIDSSKIYKNLILPAEKNDSLCDTNLQI